MNKGFKKLKIYFLKPNKFQKNKMKKITIYKIKLKNWNIRTFKKKTKF